MAMGQRTPAQLPAACERASALYRSKVQGRQFRDAPGRGARLRAPEPPACRARELVRQERSAYHGTWSAGGGRGHDDRSCSRSGLSQPMVTARTTLCSEVPVVGPSGRLCGWCLCGWFLCPTLRLLLHPSQGRGWGGAAHATARLGALPFLELP